MKIITIMNEWIRFLTNKAKTLAVHITLSLYSVTIMRKKLKMPVKQYKKIRRYFAKFKRRLWYDMYRMFNAFSLNLTSVHNRISTNPWHSSQTPHPYHTHTHSWNTHVNLHTHGIPTYTMIHSLTNARIRRPLHGPWLSPRPVGLRPMSTAFKCLARRHRWHMTADITLSGSE